MAKFVLDQQEDQSSDKLQKKQSKYDQSLSGKNVENVSTEHTHNQVRYEEDHIENLKAAKDTTEISTESDLTQTHKAGSTTTIEQRSPIVDKTYQGQSISEKTSQHDIKMKADSMSETFVGKTHEIHSYAGYQSQTPQNETYETTENITFNTTTYNVAGDKTYAKGKKIGGTATSGILKQGSLLVKTDKYKAIASSAINFMPATSPPNALRKLNQKLTDNQYEYDEIKWDHKGVYQVADIIFEPKSQNFYTLDDVKGQTQLSISAPLISQRETLSKARNARQTSRAMQNIQEELTSSQAFTSASQLVELIHFGTMHVSYMDQSAWAKFQDYQSPASSVPMDDDKQTIDFESMTQTIAGQHQDEIVENVLAEPGNSAYQRFRKFMGLHSQQSILDSTNYSTVPAATIMRYAMGLTDQLGFNNEPVLFPLTHQHEIQADYAQGKVVIEGYFPNTHGNLMQIQGQDVANGVFVAELKFELEGFAGASFLLSDSFTYQAQEEKTDNENITYPYLETQSKADSLTSVPFGNKITGYLGWLLDRPSEFSEEADFAFLHIAEAGGSTQLPQDVPQTFKVIYQDNQFHIAMNDAWLYETLKKGDQLQRGGNMMPFVVTAKTFTGFVQFMYYQQAFVQENAQYGTKPFISNDNWHIYQRCFLYTALIEPSTQAITDKKAQSKLKALIDDKNQTVSVTDILGSIDNLSDPYWIGLTPDIIGKLLYLVINTDLSTYAEPSALKYQMMQTGLRLLSWLSSQKAYLGMLEQYQPIDQYNIQDAANSIDKIWHTGTSPLYFQQFSKDNKTEHYERLHNAYAFLNGETMGLPRETDPNQKHDAVYFKPQKLQGRKPDRIVHQLKTGDVILDNQGFPTAKYKINAHEIPLQSYIWNGYIVTGKVSLEGDISVTDTSSKISEIELTNSAKKTEISTSIKEKLSDWISSIKIANIDKDGDLLETSISWDTGQYKINCTFSVSFDGKMFTASGNVSTSDNETKIEHYIINNNLNVAIQLLGNRSDDSSPATSVSYATSEDLDTSTISAAILAALVAAGVTVKTILGF